MVVIHGLSSFRAQKGASQLANFTYIAKTLESPIIIFMTKKKQNKMIDTQIIDVVGFLLALIYMQSVLTVAHHTSLWAHEGSTYTVGPPAIPALVAGFILVIYSRNKNKRVLTTLSIVTVTILLTASIFWFSGLRTNFHF